jgi:hypothetical protein
MRLPGPKNSKNWQNLHRVAKLGLGFQLTWQTGTTEAPYVVSLGGRRPAAALERLEASEEEAHRRLERAQTGGNPAIREAQEFWLKCSETLRRLDLAVEIARRQEKSQIPLRTATDVAL